MTEVLIICPIPLVFRVVKRARELDGIEERWPYGDPHEKWPTERHKLMCSFIDTGNADIFYNEVTGWQSQWTRGNEPDEEL